MKKFLLPESGNFYKANLHCHSTISDGKLSPEELKEAYKAHGYSIIAYTDHDIMIPHPELDDDNFLALTGYEMEVTEVNENLVWNKRKTCHMCLVALSRDAKQVCWHREKYIFGNTKNYIDKAVIDDTKPDFERAYTPECISTMMKMGRDAGFFVTYNHPTWSMEDYSNYINYDNMNAMEMVNYGCVVVGYDDYNPRVYDDMLRAGKRIFCISTDDNHNIQPLDSVMCDSFGGFTMIKADKLEYETVTKALSEGNFYASEAPLIEELWFEDGVVHIKTSPARTIEFTTGVRRCVVKHAQPGETITEASCKVEPEHEYIRVTVIDENGYHANTNAYFTDELFAE